MMTAPPTSRRGRRTGWLTAAVLALGTVAAALPTGAALGVVNGQANSSGDGLMCESNAGGSNAFVLDATDGYVITPDGNSIYMWGYTATGRSFQLPGPTLCVDSGAQVSVTLNNTLPEDVSILFPGQDNVRVGGTPAGPQFSGTGELTSLTNIATAKTATAAGGSVTYTFTAGSPGTYLYSSGTDVTKQREMGLFGALVVRPVDPGTKAELVDQANNDPATQFDGEFLYLLNQIDPDFHAAVEKNRAYNAENLIGRYFMINGRSMPDTLAPNNAAWLPSQPYGALIHIAANAAKPALIRYVNAGPVNYPFHPHGSSQRVFERDGQPVTTPNGTQDASQYKFLIDVGPGQTADTLERFDNVYDPAAPAAGGAPVGTCSSASPPAVTNPSIKTECASIPSDIQLPQLQDQIVGPGTETWFSENPYLGGKLNPIPNNMIQNDQCGEFYHVAHSHALYQATNYGASFGGMMTLIRIDPPGHFDCK
jgi:FtsP/CotA-like multicopper oxidase with cupredoxin domain